MTQLGCPGHTSMEIFYILNFKLCIILHSKCVDGEWNCWVMSHPLPLLTPPTKLTKLFKARSAIAPLYWVSRLDLTTQSSPRGVWRSLTESCLSYSTSASRTCGSLSAAVCLKVKLDVYSPVSIRSHSTVYHILPTAAIGVSSYTAISAPRGAYKPGYTSGACGLPFWHTCIYTQKL